MANGDQRKNQELENEQQKLLSLKNGKKIN